MGIFKNKKKEGRLLKLAYKLGYDVGFHKHNEYWGWVRKSKKTLFEEAKLAGYYGAVVGEFKKGKEDGYLAKKSQVKEKLKKTSSTLGRSLKLKMGEPVADTKKEKESFLQDDLPLLTQVKYNLIEKPLHISRATFIELPKLVKMPKFLRVLNSKK